jgi:cytoskeleton-associated protein 5
MSKW